MIRDKKVENYNNKIQEYKQAVKEVNEANKVKDNKNLEFEKEKKEVRDKYWDLQIKLDEKKKEAFNIISKKENKFDEEITQIFENPYKKMREFKRIIEFIGIYKEPYNLDLEVYQYDYVRDKNGIGINQDKERIFIKPLSILKDDGSCKIGVYMYFNSKPKNKYTLCVVGKSIFGSESNNFRIYKNFGWNYLSNISENGHFKKVIKELPTQEKLINWFTKNKDKIFKEQIDKIEEIVKEYREVIKNTKSTEWEIAYLESRKQYYENNVSSGTITKQYETILQKLKKLKGGK